MTFVASSLDHQHFGDVPPGGLPDAPEAFRNVLLVCHTNPSGSGEAWGFYVVSCGPFHSCLHSS